MELWYLRISIEKAHQIDEFDNTSKPLVSSVLDDTFYIIKKVILRLISSASSSTLQGSLTEIHQIMERDYVGGLRRKIEMSLSSIAGQVSTGPVPVLGSRSREDERDRKEKEVKTSLVVREKFHRDVLAK
jgi:conserved oligomeric Golgi complex subunit 4